MLMDLFYDNVQVQHKMRIHFHAFMQDFHKRMSYWNEFIGLRLGKEREEDALSHSLLVKRHSLFNACGATCTF
jgi:predicted ATPase